MFATGIENSYPTIVLPDGSTHRVDEMEKTGHYNNWEQDFGLVKELGISKGENSCISINKYWPV